MIKLYLSQLMLILSKKDLYILLGSFVLIIGFFLYSSGYYQEYEYQVVYKTTLFHDYLIESVSFIKLCSVIYGVYISILSRKLHYLDGLFLSRGKREAVMITRLMVLITYLFLIQTIVFLFFCLIGDFLTPIMLEYDYIQLFISIQLFGVFYMFLSYLCLIIFKVVYGPIFIVFLYFVTTIFSPFYVSYIEITNLEKVINYFMNDLIVFSDYSIMPLFGNTHLFLMIVIMIESAFFLFIKRDVAIL
jgi:hypothetical protein